LLLGSVPDPNPGELIQCGSASALKLQNARETLYFVSFSIHQIHMFLSLPDPLVGGMDPDPYII
jgi:hypothetical protein